ncbi:HNH endonuclease [Flavobacterium psychrophilum]|uniref:HNH endonuclease n=1 Tax=Flavobacterium psychrophilum TaxID=96345 RepID=A0A7U2NE75_FLAPS|nr:HNH endonuclease [Flavobacterium psychrophilum]EKT3963904.1 HNH endonuclease [Flavobacterium psychrophilum]EKT4517323.1 HNH endonuclease [Flavobacterium psychrophilum]ELM3644812.1 HNH endonuclease [Flavobacterium psychrophilum]ELV7525186.1 HNH endonuclease [Flavobacterium psychrophilum]MBF2092503.1 HNH endonuclease [Flavobacterium psychrophilum]
MENFQKIKIEEKEYFIIDSIQNLRAEDSFIYRKNKLKMFKGNGESRKYVGSYLGASGERLSDFFEYSNWGKASENGKRVYPIIQENCFFSKSNLLKYLYDSRIEYQKQEQVYNFDISEFYSSNLESINAIKNDKIHFSINDVSDLTDNKLSRGYIRSDDEIWDLWRKLVLPKISYLSILKLIPVTGGAENQKPLYYFRILLDYQFRSIVHPKLIGTSTDILIEEKTKKDRVRPIGRQGAYDYRKKVLEHMPQCPFTKISEDKLLIASHIKPYSVCIKEGRDDQAIDYLNGLALTPTYDKLFDQGYITFKDNGDLICGTLLSSYTWERLNINPNAKNNLRIYPEKRELYLEYHRQFVFQDDINDLT